MKVFKFGGASVENTTCIQNVANIIQSFAGQDLVIIISAMGKTTNALEKVATAFFNKQKATALQLFEEIKHQHNTAALALFKKPMHKILMQLEVCYTEVEWILRDKPTKSFDYYYDQIVGIGELLSTTLISHYMQEIGVKNKWIDVRDVFRTDHTFREAVLDWDYTQKQVDTVVAPLLKTHKILITQGFIGSTDENVTTTLGREGSDYSSAIFSNMLNADSLTIWKDVKGVMNADPKQFAEAQLISTLNYKEVIEMAFYGAQVIHPKTIKPLQNKSIPLYVKCFLDKDLPGTIIHNEAVKNLPPIIVMKRNQVLLTFTSKDFSFVDDKLTIGLTQLFANKKLEPNISQNTAISFIRCVDNHTDKIEALTLNASTTFDVEVEHNLTLLTIRHYNATLLQKLTADATIILQQQTPETVQVLMKEK